MDLLYGYGSLINRISAEKTLKHPVTHMYEAVLLNHFRDWSARELVVVNGRPILAAFLNIVARNNSYINGVCFPVTEDELTRMDCREKSYKRINVSRDIAIPINQCNSIVPSDQSDILKGVNNIWTYIYASDVCGPAVVLDGYNKKVLKGCHEIGKIFYDRFIESTEPAPLPLQFGSYQFADPAQERHV